jgi:hypothetical protein
MVVAVAERGLVQLEWVVEKEVVTSCETVLVLVHQRCFSHRNARPVHDGETVAPEPPLCSSTSFHYRPT